jgi:hypothetical protein
MKKAAIIFLMLIILCSSFSNNISTSYADSFDDLWITSSIKIIEDAPYRKGEELNAEFTIENKGLETVFIDAITILGSHEDLDLKRNFYWYRNISIKSGKSYRYKGRMTFDESGKYNFKIAYKIYGEEWEYEPKSEYGVKNEISLEVVEDENSSKSNSISTNQIKSILETSRANGEEIIPKTKFSDISGHWAENFIKELVLQGVIKGYPDGKFYPDKMVTKSEFAVLLCKGLLLEKKENDHSELKFLKGNWAYDYINSTFNLFNKKNLNVGDFETREELVSALVNALKWNETADVSVLVKNFTDSYSISQVNKENVALAVEKKLISGYDDGTFKGFKGITRAEACKLIQNAQLLGGNSTIFTDFIENNGIEKEIIETDDSPTPNPTATKTPDATKTDKESDSSSPSTTSTSSITFIPIENIIIPTENPNSNPNLRTERLENIFGYNQYGEIGFYTKEEEAVENIEEITITVWDIKSNGEKYTKNMKISVNRKIADEVKTIFNKIYNDEEKFPISYIASYAWRSPMASGRLSEHNYGTCLDINPSANPYIVKGKTLVGDVWDPINNPYSIGTTSSVMRVFREYKWGWGGSDWGSSTKDYMHFTYLGH